MSNVSRAILVTGSNQGLGKHTVHQLAKAPDVLIFMGGPQRSKKEEKKHWCNDEWTGSRKLAAAEEAKTKFKADIHPFSSVVPAQLDITDSASIKDAAVFIANHVREKNLPGLDILVDNAGTSGTKAAGRSST
ncbi:hypothetical protein C8R43DRAFT_1133640 [Mycena crocata]|nr:hypothetical protein C8R43DRAFT_1133640 [Mycena crocata]